MFTNPSVAQFQSQFVRDFPYGTDPKTGVLDSDIATSFTMANVNINQALFADQGTYTLAYLLLSAHYLVLNLRASSQGLNGQYGWLQNSKTAAQISESFSIPQRILDYPTFAMLAKTHYGARYLELVLPLLVGPIFTSWGPTKP